MPHDFRHCRVTSGDCAVPLTGGEIVISAPVSTSPHGPGQFLAEVMAATPGDNRLNLCVQCGSCGGSCPSGPEMEHTPRRLFALIRAGERDTVLKSNAPWYCVSCYYCTVRCPQDIHITDVMYTLKSMAIKAGLFHDAALPGFSETFVDLFRGGEAEMRLMDEDDLLECGIEIVARPPGKRLQNMMLLSGGEKALTAIALLFALFRTKPSPFCILDEVDAPLDDVNTLRYVHMLRNLAKTTQCIVITHNKLTMEVASTLYGVTMEERGVSKLVAVRLEEVQPGEPQEEEAVSA